MAMYNPCHPGELIWEEIEGLREETKKPFTIEEVAKGLKTSRKTLSAIINGKQSVTADMSLKLSVAFGCREDYYLGLQEAYDLALARRKFDAKGIRIFYKKRKYYLRPTDDFIDMAMEKAREKTRKIKISESEEPKKRKGVKRKKYTISKV